jgi:hypothetical protein
MAQSQMSSSQEPAAKTQVLSDKTAYLSASNQSVSLTGAQPGQAGQNLSSAVTWGAEEIHPNMRQLAPPEAADGLDQAYVRSQRLAFFTKQSIPSGSDDGTNSQFYRQTVREDFVETQVERVHTISLGGNATDEENPANDQPEDDSTAHQTPTMETPLQVPDTLMQDLDNSERPRDQDPMIMPIPRSFGFQFDPRQLHDLAIIAQGGNGCAREGAEFKIEEEYEWGGGGMMGWKTSTGPRYAEMSHGDMRYEAGRGDEDGLLDELPRDVDDI